MMISAVLPLYLIKTLLTILNNILYYTKTYQGDVPAIAQDQGHFVPKLVKMHIRYLGMVTLQGNQVFLPHGFSLAYLTRMPKSCVTTSLLQHSTSNKSGPSPIMNPLPLFSL